MLRQVLAVALAAAPVRVGTVIEAGFPHLADGECLQVLREAKHGVLAFSGRERSAWEMCPINAPTAGAWPHGLQARVRRPKMRVRQRVVCALTNMAIHHRRHIHLFVASVICAVTNSARWVQRSHSADGPLGAGVPGPTVEVRILESTAAEILGSSPIQFLVRAGGHGLPGRGTGRRRRRARQGRR